VPNGLVNCRPSARRLATSAGLFKLSKSYLPTVAAARPSGICLQLLTSLGSIILRVGVPPPRKGAPTVRERTRSVASNLVPPLSFVAYWSLSGRNFD
jgi:hypothetical protein